MTLPVSRLVQVDVNLSPIPAAGRNFGDLLILGDSNVISGLQRIEDFSSLDEVANAFGTTAPEYLASSLYFGQNPQPANLSIGRWLRVATAAQLLGEILSASQSTLLNFTQVTSGGFTVVIDGTSHALTGLNFSTALNLNGVASDVTTALSGAGVCTWNGSQFIITSATTGAGTAASGTVTFSGNPTASDTVTINGIVITFVASGPTGNQVLIGGTDNITAVNLATFLQNSTNASLLTQSYSVSGLVVTITYKQVGTAGNAIGLAKSSTALAVSGADLAGGLNASSVSYATSPGSGTDVSTLLGLTAAVALPLVPGYAAETALAAVQALSNISNAWYGLNFAASVMPTDDDNVSIAGFIEGDSVTRVFGATITNSNVLSSLVTTDLASRLMALGYDQSFTQYSSNSPYASCSFFGRAFSVDFTQQNATITLMFKQEPGVVAEVLTTDQANVLQSKRCNVFTAYNNDTSIIQYGTMAGPAFFDEIHGLDWLQNAIQTAVYNVLYTSTSKVPQTNAGINQFTNAIGGICDQAVFNGLAAPGVWNAPGFGQLQQGQYLKSGYYIFAQSVDLQSESDRAARKAPPIQVAIKLAGAVQSVDVLVNVNR